MAEKLTAAERAFLAGHVVPRVEGDEPCIGHGELFFPDRSHWQTARKQIAAAMAMCAECKPLRRIQCHVGAVRRQEREGIWGGEDFFKRNNPQASNNRPTRKLSHPDDIIDDKRTAS